MEDKIIGTFDTVEDAKGKVIAIENLEVNVFLKKNGNNWVASCPYFRTFGYSRISKQDALIDLDIALKTFFAVHGERGSLNSALASLGWKKHKIGAKKDKKAAYQNSDYFNIPPYLLQGEVTKLRVAV